MKHLPLLVGCLVFFISNSFAQLPRSIGFETGNINSWQLIINSGGGPYTIPIKHYAEIMSVGGVDYYSGLPTVPSNTGKYSLKLGPDSVVNGNQNIFIRIQFPVTAADTLLNFLCATVVKLGGHAPNAEGGFTYEILDAGPIVNLYTSPIQIFPTVIKPFAPNYFISPKDSHVQCSNWDSIKINLSNYVGHIILIKFEVHNCRFVNDNHWAYAYIDYFPSNFSFAYHRNEQTICIGDTTQLNMVTLGGHPPYKYKWMSKKGISCDTILNPLIFPDSSTQYIIIATDSFLNTITDTIDVIVGRPSFYTFYASICSGDSFLFNNQNLVLAGQYFDTTINYLGCDSFITLNLIVNPLPTTPAFTALYNSCFNTNTCADVDYTNYSGNLSKIVWSFIGGTPSTDSIFPASHVCYSSAGKHYVTLTITDLNGCKATTTDTVALSSDCVWPGDANSDLIVNNLDIFPIGLLNGVKGPTRKNASMIWVDQPADTFGVKATGYMNDAKHADCDGNGIINGIDIMAILLNYNNTHPKNALGNSDILNLNITPDILFNETVVTISLELGNSNLVLDSIYGIAFTLSFDEDIIDTSSINFNVSKSWLFPDDSTYFHLVKFVKDKGKVHVGLVRNDLQGKSGFGNIFTLTSKIALDESRDNYPTYWHSTVEDIHILKLNGSIIQSKIANDSALIKLGLVGENNTLGNDNLHLTVMPNIVSSTLIIGNNHQLNLKSIEIIDCTGRIVNVQTGFTNQIQLLQDVTSLSSGIYFIRIIDFNGNEFRTKFIKDK